MPETGNELALCPNTDYDMYTVDNAADIVRLRSCTLAYSFELTSPGALLWASITGTDRTPIDYCDTPFSTIQETLHATRRRTAREAYNGHDDKRRALDPLLAELVAAAAGSAKHLRRLSFTNFPSSGCNFTAFDGHGLTRPMDGFSQNRRRMRSAQPIWSSSQR